MSGADRILFVIDAVADPSAHAYLEERALLPPKVPVTLVFNKVDLASSRGPWPAAGQDGAPPVVAISALTGAGYEGLVAHLKQIAGLDSGVDAMSARARHLDALIAVDGHLATAAQRLADGGTPELVAEDLRRAQLALGEIVGVESSEELLGRIFSAFCIGK
jgi:tRNA modification GTPase